MTSQAHITLSAEENEEEEAVLVINDGEADGNVKFRIRNLTRRSESSGGGAIILNELSVDIPKGVIVGIIGPSGSGKSTLLRALNRLWEPPAGTVFLDGHDIKELDVLSLRRKVGMLFQLPVLFEGTVADNVRYGPQLSGKKLTDQDVHKLLTLAGLDSSFSVKQVLLLDEPTSALDPISTEHIEGVLEKLKKKRGMTIIMVSHSIKQIQRIADVVCLLVNGEVVEVLKPDKLSEAKHPMALRFLELSS